MTKKSFYLFYLFCSLGITLLFLVLYLFIVRSSTSSEIRDKNLFVKTIGLPDLAISTEATYIRHRSLSDLFAIYKDDGDLREYFPSSFVYNHSTILTNTPSRIQNVKK